MGLHFHLSCLYFLNSLVVSSLTHQSRFNILFLNSLRTQDLQSVHLCISIFQCYHVLFVTICLCFFMKRSLTFPFFCFSSISLNTCLYMYIYNSFLYKFYIIYNNFFFWQQLEKSKQSRKIYEQILKTDKAETTVACLRRPECAHVILCTKNTKMKKE